MQTTTLNHGDLSCEIEPHSTDGRITAKLRYRSFEVGQISGRDQGTVHAQFQAICGLVDEGGTVRHGIIMLGYHNRAFKGEVLLIDGEIIGEWASDDDEWCHFTANDASEITCSAPSPWMLHDSIADWIESCSRLDEA